MSPRGLRRSHARSFAQADYPSRQVTIVVAVAPGSQADQFARMIAEPLQQKLGKPVVVENKPGGGQVIGTALCCKVRSRRLHPDPRQPLRPHHLAATARSAALQHAEATSRRLRSPTRAPRCWSSIPSCRSHHGRADRLRQGQSRQAELRLAWRRLVHARHDRNVQGHHRDRHGARAVRGGGPLDGRLPSGQVQVVISTSSAAVRTSRPARRARSRRSATSARRITRTCRCCRRTSNPALAADFWLGMAAPGRHAAADRRRGSTGRSMRSSTRRASRPRAKPPRCIPQDRSPKEFGDKIAREWKVWGDVIRDKNLVVR